MQLEMALEALMESLPRGDSHGLEILLGKFDLVIQTPDDVEKLEHLIIQWAVQGRLGTQDSRDRPASELAERLIASREILNDARRSRRRRKLQRLTEAETPDALPDSWEWVHLSSLGLVNPRNEVDSNTEVSFIPMKLVPTEYGGEVRSEVRQWGEVQRGYTHFQDNDIAFAKITPCFQNRKSAVMRGLKNGVGAGTTELVVLRADPDYIVPDYVLLFFKSPRFIDSGISKMKGTAGQQRVPRNYYMTVPFPLPPLEEQKRIVAKVDELFEQTRQLKAQLARAAESRTKVRKAASRRLVAAETPAERGATWRLIADNFHALYADSADVDDLKQAILELAVRGKLVPQDPDDEPVPVGQSTVVEAPFQLPNGWAWYHIGDLPLEFRNGCSKRRSTTGDPIVVLRLADIDDGQVTLEDTRRIRLTSKEQEKYSLNYGDILITRVNGSIDLIGSFTPVEVGVPTAYCDHFIRLRLQTHRIGFRYLVYVSQSRLIRSQIERMFITTAGQKTVNQGHISSLVLPLPPQSEQQRIVARIDELHSLCDQLTEQVAGVSGVRDRLLDAMLAQMA